MDSNWFKIWPGKLRTVASSLPTGLQRAYLMQISVVYLDEGGLPADNAKIAFKTALPIEAVAEMSQFWDYLGHVENGQLHLDFLDEVLEERAIFAEKKARDGAKGGKAKASNPKQGQATPTIDDGEQAVLSTAKQSQANTDRQANKQRERSAHVGAQAAPLSAPLPAAANPLAEIADPKPATPESLPSAASARSAADSRSAPPITPNDDFDPPPEDLGPCLAEGTSTSWTGRDDALLLDWVFRLTGITQEPRNEGKARTAMNDLKAQRFDWNVFFDWVETLNGALKALNYLVTDYRIFASRKGVKS